MAKKKLTKAELIKILKECQKNTDYEVAHSDADDALLNYIADSQIKRAYNKVKKEYA